MLKGPSPHIASEKAVSQNGSRRYSQWQNIFYGTVIGGAGTFYTGLYSLFFKGSYFLNEMGVRAAFTHGAMATGGGMLGGGLGIFAGAYLDEKLSRFAGDNTWKKIAVAVPRALVTVGLPIGGLVAGGAGTYHLTQPYAYDAGGKVYEIRQKTENFFENLNDMINKVDHGDTIQVQGDSTLVLKHLEMTP